MSWLTSLLLALLPATHCARFLEAVRLWLVEILAGLIDEETQDFFDLTPAELVLLEANLTDAENLLRLAVGVRVCELNGWSKKGLRRHGGRAANSNPTPERLMARLERCVALLANFEDHAARRACALSIDPLRLGAARRSTSPAFAVEAIPATAAMLPPPRMWGRWLATSSSRDGGGLSANTRSPAPAGGRLSAKAS